MMVPGFGSVKRMELVTVMGDPPDSWKVTRDIDSADVAAVSSTEVARLCFERYTAGVLTTEKRYPSYTTRVLPEDGRKRNIHNLSGDGLGHNGSAMMGFRESRPAGKIMVRWCGRPSSASF